MRLITLFRTGFGALACLAAAQIQGTRALPPHALHPRHPTVTKTVFVTVSYGPSTTATLGSTSDVCDDWETSSPTPSSSSVIVSTITLTTEVATTIVLTPTPDSATLSSFISTTSLIPTSTSESSSAQPSSTIQAPAPNPTQPFTPEPHYITDPAPSPNAVLAKNAADAQALNRMYRLVDLQGRCDEGTVGCVRDVPARCTRGTWAVNFCTIPNTVCRAVPRMQTNGTALGCFTEADVLARIASTGQPGNAFGE
ncbi:hypothetical protein FRC08_010007 [Ceratobasidium sp. 394]|nr:hypothetical protein FRC08_010007 [Ceratobasidium sp. 394]